MTRRRPIQLTLKLERVDMQWKLLLQNKVLPKCYSATLNRIHSLYCEVGCCLLQNEHETRYKRLFVEKDEIIGNRLIDCSPVWSGSPSSGYLFPNSKQKSGVINLHAYLRTMRRWTAVRVFTSTWNLRPEIVRSVHPGSITRPLGRLLKIIIKQDPEIIHNANAASNINSQIIKWLQNAVTSLLVRITLRCRAFFKQLCWYSTDLPD